MANKNEPSRYEVIWEKLKAQPNIPLAIKASRNFHPRLKKAIIKRKNVEATKRPGAYLGKLEFTVDVKNIDVLIVTLKKIII